MARNKKLFIIFMRHFFKYTWFVRHVLLMILFFVIVGAIIISQVEGLQLANAIYFSFITAFTIGYGDITPVTMVGKVTSVMIGLIGIIFTGLVVAVSTKSLMSAVKSEFEE